MDGLNSPHPEKSKKKYFPQVVQKENIDFYMKIYDKNVCRISAYILKKPMLEINFFLEFKKKYGTGKFKATKFVANRI